MATSHMCHGKWRPGPVADCPKHTRLSKKQPSVYRSKDEGGSASGSGGSVSESSGESKRP